MITLTTIVCLANATWSQLAHGFTWPVVSRGPWSHVTRDLT